MFRSTTASRFYPPLFAALVIWVSACAGQTDCNDTLTCPVEGDAASTAPMGTGLPREGGVGGFSQTLSDGAVAPVTLSDGAVAPGGSGTLDGDAAPPLSPDAATAPGAKCTSDLECGGIRRRCLQGDDTAADNRCVECLTGADCSASAGKVCLANQCVGCAPPSEMGLQPVSGCPEGTLCKGDADNPKANVCVQCQTNSECADNPDGPVCWNETCVRCAPNTLTGSAVDGTDAGSTDASAGSAADPALNGSEDGDASAATQGGLSSACTDDKPFCATDVNPKANLCVQCLHDSDCMDGVCTEENVCIPCDPDRTDGNQHAGCNEADPVCLPGEVQTQNQCVQCVPASGATADESTADEGCSGASPRCLPADSPVDYTCVQCLSPADCSDALPLCVANSCAECADNSDCPDAAASSCGTDGLCAACTQDADCGHIAGLNVCNAGLCVQCNAVNPSACGDKVCDTRPGDTQFTCSDQDLNSTGTCGDCVSDAQCSAGKRCVLTSVDDTETGYFCLWKQGDPDSVVSCVDDGAPYVEPYLSSSLDGETGTFCWLAFASCQSFTDFRQVTCESDDDCGVLGVGDGLCRDRPGSAEKRCTYQCASSDDCDLGCDLEATPKYCTFTNN